MYANPIASGLRVGPSESNRTIIDVGTWGAVASALYAVGDAVGGCGAPWGALVGVSDASVIDSSFEPGKIHLYIERTHYKIETVLKQYL